MNEWKSSNLINQAVLDSLTPEQIKLLSQILGKVK